MTLDGINRMVRMFRITFSRLVAHGSASRAFVFATLRLAFHQSNPTRNVAPNGAKRIPRRYPLRG
jgi:hypothetical protein